MLIYLLRQGFCVADPNDRDSMFTDLTGSPATAASTVGLEPWFIHIRISRPEDIAATLRNVSEKAQIEASEWPVSIMARPGYDVEGSYAVMPLRVLAAIVAGSALEKPVTQQPASLSDRTAGGHSPPLCRRRVVPAPQMELRQCCITPASNSFGRGRGPPSPSRRTTAGLQSWAVLRCVPWTLPRRNRAQACQRDTRLAAARSRRTR